MTEKLITVVLMQISGMKWGFGSLVVIMNRKLGSYTRGLSAKFIRRTPSSLKTALVRMESRLGSISAPTSSSRTVAPEVIAISMRFCDEFCCLLLLSVELSYP